MDNTVSITQAPGAANGFLIILLQGGATIKTIGVSKLDYHANEIMRCWILFNFHLK